MRQVWELVKAFIMFAALMGLLGFTIGVFWSITAAGFKFALELFNYV